MDVLAKDVDDEQSAMTPENHAHRKFQGEAQIFKELEGPDPGGMSMLFFTFYSAFLCTLTCTLTKRL